MASFYSFYLKINTITFLLGYPVIMSSYHFNRDNDGQGPPSDGSGNTNNVVINS